ADFRIASPLGRLAGFLGPPAIMSSASCGIRSLLHLLTTGHGPNSEVACALQRLRSCPDFRLPLIGEIGHRPAFPAVIVSLLFHWCALILLSGSGHGVIE